jgi:hypothetical protein
MSVEKTNCKIMEHGEIKRIFPAITPATVLPLIMAMAKAVKKQKALSSLLNRILASSDTSDVFIAASGSN